MKKSFFLLALGSVVLTGCPKHEIIPAPTPQIELSGHLTGNINGSNVEFTENVDGYFVSPTKTKFVVTSPVLSTAIYYSEMKSSQGLVSVRVGLGSIYWDASVSSDPSVSQFNSFFTSPVNAAPPYALGADNGFEVVYRDGTGKIWTSKDSSPGTVAFTDIVQESDASGDYSKFNCTFSCVVYRMEQVNPFPAPMTELSLPLTDMDFDGWFKR